MPAQGFESYRKGDAALEPGATLRALLSENGEHVFRVAFDADPETPRNYFFGVVLTRSAAAQDASWPQDAGWGKDARERCVHLCYECCDAFPLCEGGVEFRRLEQTIARILGERVQLLPFTTFQRSIGQYPALLPLFRAAEYAALFRRDAGSLLDVKMHVVLARWHRARFECAAEPPAARAACVGPGGVPTDEWNTCFHSISRVFWYHAYVYELLDEHRDDFGLSTVQRTQDAVAAKGGAHAPGKLALLDILKLVYRYNYSVA